MWLKGKDVLKYDYGERKNNVCMLLMQTSLVCIMRASRTYIYIQQHECICTQYIVSYCD